MSIDDLRITGRGPTRAPPRLPLLQEVPRDTRDGKAWQSHEEEGCQDSLEPVDACDKHRGFLPPPNGGKLGARERRGPLQELASFFDSDVLDGVTSAELLASGVVRVLEQVFSNPDNDLSIAAQSAFVAVFMGRMVKSRPKTATVDSPATPLSVMIHKLQDLLSRSEHFDVITVHHNAPRGKSQQRSVHAGQADSPEAGCRRGCRHPSHVSKHNGFDPCHRDVKALDDYLRPRISLSERTRGSRREGISRALAAMASTTGLPLSAARLAERLPPPPASGSVPAPPTLPTQSSGSRPPRKSKTRPPAQTGYACYPRIKPLPRVRRPCCGALAAARLHRPRRRRRLRLRRGLLRTTKMTWRTHSNVPMRSS